MYYITKYISPLTVFLYTLFQKASVVLSKPTGNSKEESKDIEIEITNQIGSNENDKKDDVEGGVRVS